MNVQKEILKLNAILNFIYKKRVQVRQVFKNEIHQEKDKIELLELLIIYLQKLFVDNLYATFQQIGGLLELYDMKFQQEFLHLMIRVYQKGIIPQETGSDEVKSHKFFNGIDWNNIRNQEAPMIPIRDLDQLEEEESNITKKKNEEVKMKDRLQSVQVSHDGNLDDVAKLTRVDLLAKISQKDAENLMKKRSIRKSIQQFL